MAPSPFLTFHWDKPFRLVSGGVLQSLTLAYETWGTLNEDRSNAILLFSGLSASSHAKSHSRNDVPGWWEGMIGAGLALDTDRYFVVCANHLGGCFGSTGPASPNPATGEPYGPDFPQVLLQDMVEAVRLMVDDLGIGTLFCVMGASMGGMMALEYAARFEPKVVKLIMISGSGRPGALSIAYRFVQRQVILQDPHFHDGRYYGSPEQPRASLAVARMIGNITYRSGEEFNRRFGRSRTDRGYNFGPDFQIESYLHHMGHKLSYHFDANSFLVLTKAMDLYSLGYGFDHYEKGVRRIRAKCLIMGVSSDMLFPIEEQESVYRILNEARRPVRFCRLESFAGHDAFLVEGDYFSREISSFLAE